MWGASRGGDCQCCDSSANSASNAAFPVPITAADSGSDIYLFRNPQTHAPKPVVVRQTGTFGDKPVTQDSFNAAYANASWGADGLIFGVECPGCTRAELYYKRIRNPAALTNPYGQMFGYVSTKNASTANSVFNVDYEQYRTLADAIAGTNKLTSFADTWGDAAAIKLLPFNRTSTISTDANVQWTFYDISPHA